MIRVNCIVRSIEGQSVKIEISNNGLLHTHKLPSKDGNIETKIFADWVPKFFNVEMASSEVMSEFVVGQEYLLDLLPIRPQDKRKFGG